MSILLESLRQSSDKQGNDIPGVGDSHFDDEMLSDEWLLAKLRIWKMICALLGLALVITSIGWFLSASQPAIDPNMLNQQSVANQSNDASQHSVDSQKTEPEAKQAESQQKFGALEIESSVERRSSAEQQSNTSTVKQKYVPKKVTQPVDASSNANVEQSSSSPSKITSSSRSNSIAKPIEKTSLAQSATGSIIDFESLTQQQQSEMPELEISSYAVSSNSKKSFVVLNGAFYGQGEIIAPNLVLISIEKESIVVRYFDQLIRKKYGL